MQILLKNVPPIEVETVVRTVPRQREVVRGTWQNQVVYAKKFTGTRAQKHFSRDVAGVQLLNQAGITTPALLFEGETQDGGFIAIFAAVTASQNAEVAYAHLSKMARFDLMQNLVKAIAQHHQAGLIQTDLYFKNFLIADGSLSIYTLDGDGIRSLRLFNRKVQRLKNLATMFSKMDVQDENEWSQELYTLYCSATGEKFDAEQYDIFRWNAQKMRVKAISDYADKKVFRNCTDVKVTQTFQFFTAVVRDFLVDANTLRALDGFLSNASSNIKNGNTCTIAKAAFADRQVVVKRYNIKGLAHSFGRALRKSRAAISWSNSFRLIMVNIATPKPLALVEERAGFLRRRAYFLSEFVDAPDVSQFFAQAHHIEVKQQVAFEVARLFYRLSLLKISHGDCKASNIKIKDGKPLLLDLDAMQANPWFFEKKHIKDLKRFMRNWADDADTSALFKAAFLRAYDEIDDPWEKSMLARAGID